MLVGPLLNIFIFPDNGLLISPNETNIVAYKDERAVLPCLSTSSSVNVTLFKGAYYWSLEEVSVAL
jgi:hypothetical protein